MGWIPATVLIAAQLVASDPVPSTSIPAPLPTTAEVSVSASAGELVVAEPSWVVEEGRQRFASDRAFPDFIGPITNPVLTKDPRSLTEARLLYVYNEIDPDHLLGSGDLQAYGLQLRLALTDRLTFIADKDGYAVVDLDNGTNLDGWLNIAVGLKYAVIRDVEKQRLVTVGFQYEPQTGESEVFQGHGDGVWSLFVATGREFGDKWHLLSTSGYQFPMDGTDNSNFLYTSWHLDKQFGGCIYPLVEVNWFHWTGGGNRGLPAALGEGDGLLNLGTSGVSGNDLVTFAFGGKAQLCRNADLGVAWEVPLSNRHDLIDYRVTAELILRY